MRGWLLCACVMLIHWLALLFLFLESGPQNYHIDWDDRQGLRRSLGLLYYGLPTVDADDCDMARCFSHDRRCGTSPDDFTIALYPPGAGLAIQGLDGAPVVPSKWWIDTRAALRASKYFVEDPEKACVLVPNFEHTLASNEMGTSLVIAQTLRSLPSWERYGGPGFNHLLFNKHDDVGVEYDPAYAMVAKVGWSTGHYRPAFDISLNPPCGKGRPGLKDAAGHVVPTWWANPDRKRENKYFLTFLGTMRNYPLRRAIAERFHDPDNGVIIQTSVEEQIGGKPSVEVEYLDTLFHTQFTLCPRGRALYSYRTTEAIAAGAIPVILGDGYAFPYNELIDWRSFAVILPESSWETMMDVLRSFTSEEIARMRRNMGIAYNKIFKNDSTLMDTTLDILRMNIYRQRGGGHYSFGQFKHVAAHPFGHPLYFSPEEHSAR